MKAQPLTSLHTASVLNVYYTLAAAFSFIHFKNTVLTDIFGHNEMKLIVKNLFL